ncbi:hypothetical protein [Phocaeicola sp.]
MATNNFSARREQILSMFNQATSELNGLNDDIDKTIEANTNEIASRQAQNKELEALRANNNKTVKFFTKLLKA